MKRNACIFSFLVLSLAALGGCSSGPTAKESKKAVTVLDKIQGKAQVLMESGGATDAAMNPGGGSSVYLWEGTTRYRLFLKTAVEIVHGKEYVAEGIIAQKAIDEIGDPDDGKNGYPLQDSCERVVRKAWANISFDAIEPTASLLRSRVKRYPARPVFLVTRIQPVEETAAAADSKKAAAAEEKDVREVAVAADKQKASLIEGPTVQTAPLWDRTGGTVHCKVIIDTKGKISEIETGEQLCEAVPWSQFRYQPPVQAGHPVRVSTEVEVRFEPRK
jgi:hypothetical protein